LSEILIAPPKVADKPAPDKPTENAAADSNAAGSDNANPEAPNRLRRPPLWLPRRLKLMNCSSRSGAGANFDDIAKKNSSGPSAAQGGDLGVFKRGTLAKEIEDKTFAMKVG